MHDLRDAFRALRATPIVTAVAILSLALGIGANTAMFSILDSLMLRSLPVRQPQQLARVMQNRTGLVDQSDLGTDPRAPGAVRRRVRLVGRALQPRRRRRDAVRRRDLGERPVLRHARRAGDPRPHVTPTDDRRGGGPDGPVAVISYGFWQRRFGGAADVIGQQLTVERVPFTIVGVTPPEFFGTDVGRTFDVAIPLGTEPLIRGKESALDRARAPGG